MQDPLLTLTCKHGQLPRRRSRQQIAALDQTHSNTIHRLGHAGRTGGGPGRPAAPRGRAAAPGHGRRPHPGRAGATRGATSGADLTQWRACLRTTTPPPRPAADPVRACSRPATRCTSATTSARWSSGSALQETHDAFYCVVDLHAITVDGDPARAARAHPAHGRPVPRRRASTRSGRALFVQSHVPEHAAAGLGAELPHRLRRGRPDDPVQGQVGRRAPSGTTVGPVHLPDAAWPPTSCCTTRTRCRSARTSASTSSSPATWPSGSTAASATTFVVPEPYIVKATGEDLRPAGPDGEDEQVARPPRRRHRPAGRPDRSSPRRSGRRSPTPSREVRYDPATKPGVSNLLTHLLGADRPSRSTTLEDDVRRQGLRRPQEGRRRGGASSSSTPFRERTPALLDDPAELDRILADGADRARDGRRRHAGPGRTTGSASSPASARAGRTT